MTAKSTNSNQACNRRRKAENVQRQTKCLIKVESLATMIASEQILAREWDTSVEDAAWVDL